VYLPEEIGRLNKLKVLNLSSNMLKYLPYTISKLKELQALWLAENQVKYLFTFNKAGTLRF
jgi:Leucine-rich repeat (LRR) protein